MKYFLDTEFLEGPQKESFPISLFRKQTPPTIDLISIGIVAEDGREFYAISNEFNLKEAWNRFDLKEEKGAYVWKDGIIDGEVIWFPTEEGKFTIQKKVYWIRENVLRPIFKELCLLGSESSNIYSDGMVSPIPKSLDFTFKNFKRLLNKYGKTNKEIADGIINFIGDEPIGVIENSNYAQLTEEAKINIRRGFSKPEFYAYFADYDWVVFCWIFGKMMDLPEGFPMYCNDLKQEFDRRINKTISASKESFKEASDRWKNKLSYPKQENEHNALSDAKWNKKLYEFLNSF